MDENRNIHSPVKHASNVRAAQVFTGGWVGVGVGWVWVWVWVRVGGWVRVRVDEGKRHFVLTGPHPQFHAEFLILR